jgi:hypothetical protein
LLGLVVLVSSSPAFADAAAPAPAPKAPPPVSKTPARAPGAVPHDARPKGAKEPSHHYVLPPANWADDLPPAGKVRASIRGSNAEDTALRQQAAFNILRRLMSELAGFAVWPPAAEKRLGEYEKASPQTVGSSKNPYETNIDFQRDLLSKLVSAGTADAYKSGPSFQKLEAQEQRVQQAAAQSRKESAAAAAAAEAAIPPWVKADVKEAQKGHVDTSLFGLELGRPLVLPIAGTTRSVWCRRRGERY